MEQNKGYAAARAKTSGRPAREKQPGNAQCNGILAEYRRSLAGWSCREKFSPGMQGFGIGMQGYATVEQGVSMQRAL